MSDEQEKVKLKIMLIPDEKRERLNSVDNIDNCHDFSNGRPTKIIVMNSLNLRYNVPLQSLPCNPTVYD